MEKFTRLRLLAMVKCGHMVFSACDGSQLAMMHGVANMTRKQDLQLDKEPAIIDTDKETSAQRLVKLRAYLIQETAVHGNSLYAQDLQETISTIENRKW